MKATRVGVVMGGTSAEREVSMRGGVAVAEALSEAGYEVVQVVLGDGVVPPLVALERANMDVAFLVLHGRLGEDGCIQGLLELPGIPYGYRPLLRWKTKVKATGDVHVVLGWI